MKIIYKKRFFKQFDRLPKKSRVAVKRALGLLRDDPLDARLDNHLLKGSMEGLRAITAGHDLRIVFKEHDGYTIVIIIKVGTHEQVYGKS